MRTPSRVSGRRASTLLLAALALAAAGCAQFRLRPDLEEGRKAALNTGKIDRVDRSKYQPWIYCYPTGLSLRFSPWGLDRLLRELEARLDRGRIDLVARSMGSLVSRAALDLRRESGDRALVEHFVTLSTPWAGIPAARRSTLALTEAPSWRDMIPESEFLRGLRTVPLDPAIEHTLLFGYRADKLSTDSNDGKVTLASELPLEIQEGARRIRGFDASHESILTDPKVSALLDRVLGQGFGDVETGSAATAPP